MSYVLQTPNKLYNGITEGVQFKKGIGTTSNQNIRNVLVNDYGYLDVTGSMKDVAEGTAEVTNTAAEDLGEKTVAELKEIAKVLKLANYSRLKRDELVELIQDELTKNA